MVPPRAGDLVKQRFCSMRRDRKIGTNERVGQARETNHQKYELTPCGMTDKCSNRKIVASCCHKRCSRLNCGNKRARREQNTQFQVPVLLHSPWQKSPCE